MKLVRDSIPLTSQVDVDDILLDAFRPFDLDPNLVTEFYPFVIPDNLPTDFTVGVIVGGSGTGKSTLLNRFGKHVQPQWETNKAIVSHFSTAEEAQEKLHAVGLNSVPIWRLPFYALSTGQKFRADLARSLYDGAVIDEYTSVVDRSVAISASKSLRTYLNRFNVRNVVISTCHRDVLDWLQPDWIIDTDAEQYSVGYDIVRPKWWAEYLKVGEPVGRIILSK